MVTFSKKELVALVTRNTFQKGAGYRDEIFQKGAGCRGNPCFSS